MALNWNNAAAGAATGVGMGAPLGPWGAAGGAALGGLTGLFGFGKAKKTKLKDYANFSPGQSSLIDELAEGVRSGNKDALAYLNSILSDDESAFADFEAPYKQQFEQEVVPNILEKFTGQGARNSSAARQSLATAGKDLSMNLAAQRAKLKESAVNQLLGLTDRALTKKNTPYIQQGSSSIWSDLAPYAMRGGDQGIQDFLAWYQKQRGI